MPEQNSPTPAAHPKCGLSTERRAWVRMPNDHEASCQPVAASTTRDELDTAWLGRVRDVSPGGIALVLNHRFELGTALIVELSAKSKVVSNRRPVRVVHVKPEGKGRWIIGCAFASVLTHEELKAFLRE